jgi:hypothetical protein
MRVNLIKNFVLFVLLFNINTMTCAGIPVWIFSKPNPVNVTISPEETKIVQYTVTNQSHEQKNLVLHPNTPPGINASPCQLAPAGQLGSTCNLSLTIMGNQIPNEGIHQGPVLCNNNLSQCYQPSQNSQLSVQLVPPTELSATVTPSGESNIEPGESIAYTVTANGGSGVYNYQWFTCNDISCMTPTLINGATNDNYLTSTLLPEGTYYYRARVTDSNINATASNVVTLIIASSCIVSGATCDLNNPGACCSLTCVNANPTPICL